VQLKKFQEAADLGDEIGAKDSEWLNEHGAAMFRLATDISDGARIARLIAALSPQVCPQDIIERTANVLSRFGLQRPALALTLTEGVRQELFSITSKKGVEDAELLRIQISEAVKATTCPPGRKRRAREIAYRVVAALARLQNTEEAACQVANESILAGIDGVELRRARFDGAARFDLLIYDAQWFVANGGFDDPHRRQRLLNAARTSPPATGKMSDIEACALLVPDWDDASREILRRAISDVSRKLSQVELSIAFRYAMAQATTIDIQDMAIDCIAFSYCSAVDPRRQQMEEAVGKLRPADISSLVKLSTRRRSLICNRFALLITTCGPVKLLPLQLLETLRIISDYPGADPEAVALRMFITNAITLNRRDTLEESCKSRQSKKDIGGAIAATVLGTLYYKKSDYQSAVDMCNVGDMNGDFAALNIAIRGLAQASIEVNAATIRDLNRAEELLKNDLPQSATSLFQMQMQSVANLFQVRSSDVVYQRAKSLQSLGQWEDATTDYLSLPIEMRDESWHDLALKCMWLAGRGPEATEILRQLILKDPRSMESIYRRFRYQTSQTNKRTTDKLAVKDAASLAKVRFPWCAQYAGDEIEPIRPCTSGPHVQSSQGVWSPTTQWASVPVGSSRVSDESTQAAWLVIADELLPVALSSARTLAAARSRIGDLANICTRTRLDHVQGQLEYAAQLASRVSASRPATYNPFLATLNQSKRHATQLIIDLDAVSAIPCLREETVTHALWIASLIADRRIKGTAQAIRILATKIDPLFSQSYARTSLLDAGLNVRRCLAAVKHALGQDDAARAVLNTPNTSASTINRRALRLGIVPLVGDWRPLQRLDYFTFSSRPAPRLLRILFALSIVAGWYFTWMIYAVSALMFIAALWWPYHPARSSVTDWKRPDAWPSSAYIIAFGVPVILILIVILIAQYRHSY
jgi:tetratricopeptide (TPR) repeat protein